MLEKPDAADLLATARDVVLKEILPALPPDKALAVRMVAAAIALALRELEADAAAVHPRDLAALSREIREGRHDPGASGHVETAAFLRAYAWLRAEVSAPKALAP